jgi:hypothetical protein
MYPLCYRRITFHRSHNLCKPTYKVKHTRQNVAVHADFLQDVQNTSYYVGKGIVLFTMFYTGLNYFHYKQLREDMDANKDKTHQEKKSTKK